MTAQSHSIPAWLNEHVDGKQMYLKPTVETLNEPEGRALTEYLRQRVGSSEEDSETAYVVLDLAQVGLITSPALGALIVIHKRLVSSNRQLILFNLSKMLHEALSFLKLDKVFTICGTSKELEKALASR